MEANRERLIAEDIDETGKLRSEAHGEVDRTVATLHCAAEESLRIPGEILTLDAVPTGVDRTGRVQRFPIGPILGITPFNFPLLLAAHKLGPAFAAGNSIVIKPASKTPLTTLSLAELAREAGFPDGSVSVLPMSGARAESLVRDDRFKVVTFTGSAEVGWGIKANAGLKRVTLELGGNGALIVHNDADITPWPPASPSAASSTAARTASPSSASTSTATSTTTSSTPSCRCLTTSSPGTPTTSKPPSAP